MSSGRQNENLQRLLKAEENANRLIRDAKNHRTKIYKDIEAEVIKMFFFKLYQNDFFIFLIKNFKLVIILNLKLCLLLLLCIGSN